jgi:hypothetical protein
MSLAALLLTTLVLSTKAKSLRDYTDQEILKMFDIDLRPPQPQSAPKLPGGFLLGQNEPNEINQTYRIFINRLFSMGTKLPYNFKELGCLGITAMPNLMGFSARLKVSLRLCSSEMQGEGICSFTRLWTE